MYESPINVIVQEASEHMEQDLLNNITKLLLRYDIKVDSKELLRALQYDREQYSKGYRDGVTATKKAFQDAMYRVINDPAI